MKNSAVGSVVRGSVVGSFLFGLVALAGASAARANEAAQLLESLISHRKAVRVAEVESLLARVPEIYKSSASGPQSKLRAELGKIAKDKKLGSARVAAVRVCVRLDDPKNAWKAVDKLIPKPKTEVASELDLAVVKAAGALAQAKASKPLLELAAKAQDPKLAAASIRALSGFRANVKARVRILDELVSLGKRIRPGQPASGKGGSADAAKRWEAVAPALVDALNGLTERDLEDFDAWVELRDQNKRKLKELFPAEE